MNTHPVNKARAVAHYSQMAEEARVYRADQDRLDRIAAELQVDALLARIRMHDTSGFFEPSWMERVDSAFRREFGQFAVFGMVAVGAFFIVGALLWAVVL